MEKCEACETPATRQAFGGPGNMDVAGAPLCDRCACDLPSAEVYVYIRANRAAKQEPVVRDADGVPIRVGDRVRGTICEACVGVVESIDGTVR